MDWVFCDGNVSLINTQYQYPYLNTRYIKIHLTALQCNCLGSALILSYGNVRPSSYHGVHEAASDLSKEYSFLMGEEHVHTKFLFICLQLHFLKLSVGIILDYGQHESFFKSFLFKLI
jgi:hypothetical protein